MHGLAEFSSESIWPGAHSLHTVSPQPEYVPAGQSSHGVDGSSSTSAWPDTQNEHLELPLSEYWPDWQLSHDDSATALDAGANLPAAQPIHTTDPPSAKKPGVHAAHSVAGLLSSSIVPGEHSRQLSPGYTPPAVYVPTLHLVQGVSSLQSSSCSPAGHVWIQMSVSEHGVEGSRSSSYWPVVLQSWQVLEPTGL